MRVVAVLQARMSSTRLPGKVMEDLHGSPMIVRQIQRVGRSMSLDAVVVATSIHPSDDAIADRCGSIGVDVFRGSLDDVLGRIHGAAHDQGAEQVVRLTADCPLADSTVIDRVVDAHTRGAHDYTSNTVVRTYPDGLDVEVMTIQALDQAWADAHTPYEREHVTPYFYGHPDLFDLGVVRASEDFSAMRWTVDEPPDLEFVRRVYAELYPEDEAFTWRDVLTLLDRLPWLSEINTLPTARESPRLVAEFDREPKQTPRESV